MAAPDFWNSQEKAQQQIEEVGGLRRKINPCLDLEKRASDLEVLKEFAAEDPGTLPELEQEHTTFLHALDAFELQQFLSGPSDRCNCFLTIHSGAGVTESCDWADMLMRMYVRWAERNDFKVSTVDIQLGEEAGIKGATLRIEGEHAFGYLACERGVHRLVRISPFDSNKRRHTSFASVDAVHELSLKQRLSRAPRCWCGRFVASKIGLHETSNAPRGAVGLVRSTAVSKSEPIP